MRKYLIYALPALLLGGGPSSAVAAAACEQLSALTLPETTITSARVVSRGGPLAGIVAADAARESFTGLPAFCRVNALLTPSPDSRIEMELWLPTESRNGKLQAVGNGGWEGVIRYADMAAALRDGYATAATDTGHKGDDGLFAIGHPEKLIDFGYRAVHELSMTSKAIVKVFYDRAPQFSYWNGCSAGGRQGLMEAQRYPEDFDAIIAGAPANYVTHAQASSLRLTLRWLAGDAGVVPARKFAMLNAAVLQACDASDGVRDGILSDPRSCHFDVTTLLCASADGAECLTAPQLESVRSVYSPARTNAGVPVFPGKAIGSEAGWTLILGGTPPLDSAVAAFQVAYNDAHWNWRAFDLDRDLKAVDDRIGPIVNAINPDLSAFKAHGGKLLLFHGWNDTAISPDNTIDYYSTVLSTMGPEQDNWIRLFMAPGMQHCGLQLGPIVNGPGPNQVNYIRALERWRESDIAPDRLVASRLSANGVEMTRPLCPFPEVARFQGIGSTNDAANFVCRLP